MSPASTLPVCWVVGKDAKALDGDEVGLVGDENFAKDMNSSLVLY
jgi:hypothetical protein